MDHYLGTFINPSKYELMGIGILTTKSVHLFTPDLNYCILR